MRQRVSILSAAFVGAFLLSLDAGSTSASHTCAAGPSVCGQSSGLVHFKKDAIHATLIRNENGRYGDHKKGAGKEACPWRMLIFMRPSEYKPKDYLNPTVGGVFSEFNENYSNLVQRRFGLGQLDRSGWSRYAPDLDRENTQLIDVCGLQALIDSGAFTKTSIAALTDADMARSDPFFQDAGFSRGLGYNLFCDGNVAGVDGRIYQFGIHDKGGNNGGRKVNIFDPEHGRWVKRPIPCVRSEWEADPTGTAPHCDALDETNTDPPDPSDMKYQRWYPSAVTLPDGRILVLSGTDQDTSKGPGLASATKVRQPVPEVYDPYTDRTIALENARKLLNMYPRSFVTQTGPGRDNWKVCVTGGEVDPPLPGTPGGPDIEDYDPFIYNGETYCLDVLAALADPNRDVPAENCESRKNLLGCHWQFIDTATATNAHDSGAAARMVTINADGTWSQKVFLFGGNNGEGPGGSVATAEWIDFSDPSPKWQLLPPLGGEVAPVPANQNNVVALPDGNLLVVGGRAGGVNSLHYQLYNPADGTRRDLVSSPVPRHDHSTALIMPNGAVWVMGGNRVNLITGPGANENMAVPVLDSYKPPYFFSNNGPRPVIEKAPDQIRYGKKFEVEISGDGGDVDHVVLLRTGPITHNWTWGNQYVRLPLVKEKRGKPWVTAPPLPGLAVPGDYLLFAVSEKGVPSEGRYVRLQSLVSKHDGDADKDDDDEKHEH
jgi:hypothetical protein